LHHRQVEIARVAFAKLLPVRPVTALDPAQRAPAIEFGAVRREHSQRYSTVLTCLLELGHGFTAAADLDRFERVLQ